MNSLTDNDPRIARALLWMSAWFGLVTGLGEGVAFIVRQFTGALMFVSTEILWIAPVFDLFLDLFIGLGLLCLYRLWPRLPVMALAFLIFAFVLVLNWILVIAGQFIAIAALLLVAFGVALQWTRWFQTHELAFQRWCRSSMRWVVGALFTVFLVLETVLWLGEWSVSVPSDSASLSAFVVLGLLTIVLVRVGRVWHGLWLLAAALFASIFVFPGLLVILLNWIPLPLAIGLALGIAGVWASLLVHYTRRLNSLVLEPRTRRASMTGRNDKIPPIVGRAAHATLTRREFLVGSSTALAGLAIGMDGWATVVDRVGVLPSPRVAPPAPGLANVVFIVVDTLRADHLSCLGYARKTSPNLDRLAHQGVLFENAYSASPTSLPSHASLFTGRPVHEHGAVWDSPKAMFTYPHSTIAEVMLAKGYRTGAFSANLYWVTREEGFGRGFVHFDDFFTSPDDSILRTLYGRSAEKVVLQRLGWQDIPARKRAADVNASALNWVDRDRTRPFFMFLNYIDVHDPYLPPAPYDTTYSRSKSPHGILNCGVGRCDPSLSPEELQAEIDAYDGSIAYVDDQINRLVQELDRRGLRDNTLLVITSDHGEAFGEHNLFLHENSLYRELVHVPLLISKSGLIPAEKRIHQAVSTNNLAATILSLLGNGAATGFPGVSLAPLWLDPNDTADYYPLAEIGRMPWMPSRSPVHANALKSLVSNEWHYIENDSAGFELYDLRNDPTEQKNLAARPEQREVIATFREMLAPLWLRDRTHAT